MRLCGTPRRAARARWLNRYVRRTCLRALPKTSGPWPVDEVMGPPCRAGARGSAAAAVPVHMRAALRPDVDDGALGRAAPCALGRTVTQPADAADLLG